VQRDARTAATKREKGKAEGVAKETALKFDACILRHRRFFHEYRAQSRLIEAQVESVFLGKTSRSLPSDLSRLAARDAAIRARK
jgi:hypothetical protein